MSCYHLNSTALSPLYKPHTTHNLSIRSDEGLTLETAGFRIAGQFTLSTPLIRPNFCVELPFVNFSILNNKGHCYLYNKLHYQMKNDPRSYDRNFYNCVKKPEKNSGLQRGLNP